MFEECLLYESSRAVDDSSDIEGGYGGLRAIGRWSPDAYSAVSFDEEDLRAAAGKPRLSVHVVREEGYGRVGVAIGGRAAPGPADCGQTLPLLATLPPLYPEWLGDRSFGETHGVRDSPTSRAKWLTVSRPRAW